jgi:glycogen debranching enzyme
MSSTTQAHIKEAYDIAAANLRQCYSQHGISAGPHHFSDVWVRDCTFACWGALELGDVQVVKDAIKAYLDFRSKDNQVPLRIGDRIFLLKFFRILNLFPNRKPVGVFIEDKYVSKPTDDNSLLILLIQSYYEYTGDDSFIHEYYDELVKVMDWNDRQCNDAGLMSEGEFASWADSIRIND